MVALPMGTIRAPSSSAFAAPSFYRHVGFPEWGVGVVVFRDPAQEEITLFFEVGGLQTVSTTRPSKQGVLLSVPIQTVDEDLRGRLVGLAKGRRSVPGREGSMTVRRRKPAEPSPAKSSAPVIDDDSSDVMDRRRRIPGSYETGKRR